MRELKAAITQAELQGWLAFFEVDPFDDLHWFYRPAALIALASQNGLSIEDSLAFLRHETPPAGYSEADLNTFKAFGVTPPSLTKH